MGTGEQELFKKKRKAGVRKRSRVIETHRVNEMCKIERRSD